MECGDHDVARPVWCTVFFACRFVKPEVIFEPLLGDAVPLGRKWHWAGWHVFVFFSGENSVGDALKKEGLLVLLVIKVQKTVSEK